MADRSDVEACLGAAVAIYFANKRRGGDAGNKGTRYEDYFVACKVAQAAAALMDDVAANDPHVSTQVGAFVDDARFATPTATGYYQLKNANTVTWTTGDNPIATDFAWQFRLCSHLREPAPTTSLVVSSTDLAADLRESIPDVIKSHTQVVHFPWTVTLNRLVLESEEIRRHLSALANVENASNDVLSGVMYALMNAVIEKPEGDTIRGLLAHAAKLFPSQLRALPVEEDWHRHLREEFTQVLANIEGLSYRAARGFFHWSGFGMSGTFASDVTSDAFKAFQDDIVRRNPATFEAFEKVLP